MPNFNIKSVYEFENFGELNDKICVIISSENLDEDGLGNAFASWNAEAEGPVKWELPACNAESAEELFWDVAEKFQQCADAVTEHSCTCDLVPDGLALLDERYKIALSTRAGKILLTLVDKEQDDAFVLQYPIQGNAALRFQDPGEKFSLSDFMQGDATLLWDSEGKLAAGGKESTFSPAQGLFRHKSGDSDLMVLVPDSSRTEVYKQSAERALPAPTAVRFCATAGEVMAYDAKAKQFLKMPVRFKAAVRIGNSNIAQP